MQVEHTKEKADLSLAAESARLLAEQQAQRFADRISIIEAERAASHSAGSATSGEAQMEIETLRGSVRGQGSQLQRAASEAAGWQANVS